MLSASRFPPVSHAYSLIEMCAASPQSSLQTSVSLSAQRCQIAFKAALPLPAFVPWPQTLLSSSHSQRLLLHQSCLQLTFLVRHMFRRITGLGARRFAH